MGPISCDGSYGSYGIDHDGSNRFDGIDFDNGAKPVGTASFGLDLRCGLLPNECPNEDRPVRISPFSVLHLTFDLCALGVLCVRISHAEGAENAEAVWALGSVPNGGRARTPAAPQGIGNGNPKTRHCGAFGERAQFAKLPRIWMFESR